MSAIHQHRTTKRPARDHRFTFDAFCVVVKDGQKADLLDGVIYMASPDNLDAAELFTWLFILLGMYVEENDLGDIYGARVAFKLDDYNSPEPDIAFVSKDRPEQAQTGHYEGPPDLAIEIVSPESVERDYVKKRAKYEEAGVREYWIIDELTEEVKLLRLSRSGKFKEVKPKKGIFHSEVLPGFWLDPAWLWEEPRPKKKDVLKQILEAQP